MNLDSRKGKPIDKYRFEDLFDLGEIQKLTDAISNALEIGLMIVAPSGEPITRPSNSCSFCMNIVRKTEQGRKSCYHSDAVLGRYSDKPQVSKCLSAGLWDAGISIAVEGKHLASWMVGQVLLEEEALDEQELRDRARKLGIDEELFLREIKNVPKKSSLQFERILDMIYVVAQQLSGLGLKNYLQREELLCRMQLEADLRREKAHLEYFHTHDDLTGLCSRYFFEEKMDKAVRNGEFPMAIIAGDVNSLKLANDVFGHMNGDAILQSIARIMRQQARDSYIIGRCGGDEINIIIPGGTRKEALDYCDRVKRECKKSEQGVMPLSISMGIWMMESSGEDIRDCFKQAEAAMYEAKMKMKRKQSIRLDILERLYRKEYLLKEQVEEARRLVCEFSKYLDLDKRTCEELELAAQFQDIGLIAVPEEILKKSVRTQEEQKILCRHPETGYRLAKLYDESFPVSNIILQSHECWNGEGYPTGIKGEEILYTARIIHLVSAYIDFIWQQPRGCGLSKNDAEARIRAGAEIRFDPGLCSRFLEFLQLN